VCDSVVCDNVVCVRVVCDNVVCERVVCVSHPHFHLIRRDLSSAPLRRGVCVCVSSEEM